MTPCLGMPASCMELQLCSMMCTVHEPCACLHDVAPMHTHAACSLLQGS